MIIRVYMIIFCGMCTSNLGGLERRSHKTLRKINKLTLETFLNSVVWSRSVFETNLKRSLLLYIVRYFIHTFRKLGKLPSIPPRLGLRPHHPALSTPLPPSPWLHLKHFIEKGNDGNDLKLCCMIKSIMKIIKKVVY